MWMIFDRQARRSLRELRARRREALETPWGFRLIGPRALAAGTFEPEETRLVRDLLVDVELLVNVGAHVGYYCCHALQMGKSVIAVEPNTENMHYLLRNIHGNGWGSKVEVFPVAVGEHQDILEMWGADTAASLVPGWAGNATEHPHRVPVLTLDRIASTAVAGRRALFIMDVEGAEHLALRGALRCVENQPRPIWMIEITDTTHRPKSAPINPNLEEIFRTFLDRGYRCTTADRRAEPVSLERVLAAVRGERLPAHNFIFR